jgi:hypothetical protein
MQSLRKLGSSLGLAVSRQARALATEAANDGTPFIHHLPPPVVKPGAIQKEQYGLYVLLAISAGLIARDIIYPEHEFEGVIPPYPYMRIRDGKEQYPWGPDGLFETKRLVGEKPV